MAVLITEHNRATGGKIQVRLRHFVLYCDIFYYYSLLTFKNCLKYLVKYSEERRVLTKINYVKRSLSPLIYVHFSMSS